MIEKDFSNLIKFLRVQDGVKQSVLSKKLGISTPHLSLIERCQRTLSVKDFINSMNFFNCQIKIIKDGKDCVNMMNNKIKESNLNISESGYSRNYVNKNGQPTKVEFNLLDNNIITFIDMFNNENYLSEELFDKYDEEYNGEDGYGLFYQNYYESSNFTKIIGEYDNNSKQLNLSKSVYEIFSKETVKDIENTFLDLL